MKGMRDGNTKKGGKFWAITINENLPPYPIFKNSATNREVHKQILRIYIFGLFPISFFLFPANLSEKCSYSLSPYHSYIDLSQNDAPSTIIIKY